MRAFFVASVAVAALSTTSSFAADMAARPYTKAPPAPMVAIYDWTGFYIGANGGFASSRKCWDFISPGTGNRFAEGCHHADGGIVGGQVGYRWQSAAWVFGLEAQGDWADLTGSNVSTFFPLITNRTKVEALGLFTGQVGYAWNNTLLYVKGGAAVTSDKYSYGATATGLINATASETRWGGVVGVGVEVGFAPNWTVGIEYDHAFMDRRNVTFTQLVPAGFPVDSIKQDLDMVTARINYRWGGPVVARY